MRVFSTLLVALASSVGFSQYILVGTYVQLAPKVDIVVDYIAPSNGSVDLAGTYEWTDSVVGSTEPCPWTSPFASLFVTPRTHQWHDWEPNVQSGDRVQVKVNYNHSTGWEQWRTPEARSVQYPNPTIQLPEPPPGHFRRTRDVRSVTQVRIYINGE
jgi:hypothetical protein